MQLITVKTGLKLVAMPRKPKVSWRKKKNTGPSLHVNFGGGGGRGGGEEERNIGIEEKLREVGYDRVRDRLY